MPGWNRPGHYGGGVEDVEDLVAAARAGDAMAWKALVDGHAGLVWGVIRGFRFDDDTARDVFQTVWLRLAEHLDRIREPGKVPGWLARTARNECVGVTRHRARVVPAGDPTGSLGSGLPSGGAGGVGGAGGSVVITLAGPSPADEPGAGLERAEERRAVVAAFARLGQRCQELLRLLVADPPVSYEAISQVLGIPVGSIGPTRARCLASLRATPEISRISAGLRSS